MRQLYLRAARDSSKGGFSTPQIKSSTRWMCATFYVPTSADVHLLPRKT
ncbi:MAG TPA: hypothetical protein VM821_02795 [Abditibacteriaceae bacterium]|nr:hypothetical protein [Abditibacteriaceae bacterium]